MSSEHYAALASMYVMLDRVSTPYVNEALWNPPRKDRVWRGVVANGCIYVVHFIPAFRVSKSVGGELRVYTPKLLSTATSELAQFVYHVMSARAIYRPGTDVVVMSMSCYDNYLVKNQGLSGNHIDFEYASKAVAPGPTAIAVVDGELMRFQLDVSSHELIGRIRELLMETRDFLAFYYASNPPHRGSALIHGVGIYLIPTDAVSRVVRVVGTYTSVKKVPWTPADLLPGIALLITSALIAFQTQNAVAFIPFTAGIAFILNPWLGWLWALTNLVKKNRFRKVVRKNGGSGAGQ